MEKLKQTPRSQAQLTAYKHFSKITFKQMSLGEENRTTVLYS